MDDNNELVDNNKLSDLQNRVKMNDKLIEELEQLDVILAYYTVDTKENKKQIELLKLREWLCIIMDLLLAIMLINLYLIHLS